MHMHDFWLQMGWFKTMLYKTASNSDSANITNNSYNKMPITFSMGAIIPNLRVHIPRLAHDKQPMQ